MTDQMPSAEDAYARFRRSVDKKAAELKKPLEVSQAALWAKHIATEAFDGKQEGCFTFRAEDGRFGFSEKLVNQCIEFAMRYSADDCWSWGPGHYECAMQEIERLNSYMDSIGAGGVGPLMGKENSNAS